MRGASGLVLDGRPLARAGHNRGMDASNALTSFLLGAGVTAGLLTVVSAAYLLATWRMGGGRRN